MSPKITLQLYSSSLKNFINIIVLSLDKFNLLLKSSNFISLFHFSLFILLEFSFKMDSHFLDKSFKFFNFRCAYSGQVLSKGTRSLDHIKSLNQGGEHEIWNVVPMDRGLNSSKNDKDLLEWYKSQDFFSEERLQKIYDWQEYAFNKWHNKEDII